MLFGAHRMRPTRYVRAQPHVCLETLVQAVLRICEPIMYNNSLYSNRTALETSMRGTALLSHAETQSGSPLTSHIRGDRLMAAEQGLKTAVCVPLPVDPVFDLRISEKSSSLRERPWPSELGSQKCYGNSTTYSTRKHIGVLAHDDVCY